MLVDHFGRVAEKIYQNIILYHQKGCKSLKSNTEGLQFVSRFKCRVTLGLWPFISFAIDWLKPPNQKIIKAFQRQGRLGLAAG